MFTSLNKKIYILIAIGFVIILAIFIAVFQSGIIKQKTNTTGEETTNTITPASGAIQSTYTHASPKFSFEYPKGFSAGSFPEGENSETILIRDKSGENSIQILISPFDENIVLTKKRILKDAPDTEIKNEKEIIIGKDAKGLQFQSTNSSGTTIEVWFVYNNHLYQISVPQALSPDLGTKRSGEGLLNDILTTWKWNK